MTFGLGSLFLAVILAGCAIGPDYSREPAPVPTHYKELKGWKLANPSDNLDRGDWWTAYRDRGLDVLLPQVEISNQTVAASAAAYEEARAIIREGQATLFPVATANYTATRTRTGALAGTTGGSAVGVGLGTRYTTQYSAPISGSWDIDVWGKLRRQIESDTAAAQASAADLDNAKLSQQAMLATAYFNLRASDSLIDLLQRTIAEYKKTYDIVNNQFKAGYSVTAGDVATADANIRTTEAQLATARSSRAQFEHAIAVLIGRPPAELGVAPRDLAGGIPRTPITVPSTLLERRPDIAASERTMQEQNALIGVAEAAYFPDISLSSMIQYLGPIPLAVFRRTFDRIDRRQRHANLVQRRPDRGAGRRGACGLLAERGELPADGAHRLSAGRRPARGDPFPVAATGGRASRRRRRAQSR